MEKSSAIKGPDEIKAMRCSSHACETAVQRMGDFARTSISDGIACEDGICAILHAENNRRGGE